MQSYVSKLVKMNPLFNLSQLFDLLDRTIGVFLTFKNCLDYQAKLGSHAIISLKVSLFFSMVSWSDLKKGDLIKICFTNNEMIKNKIWKRKYWHLKSRFHLFWYFKSRNSLIFSNSVNETLKKWFKKGGGLKMIFQGNIYPCVLFCKIRILWL